MSTIVPPSPAPSRLPGPQQTALVLSAGGMFGAYQAGVWAELARTVRPDIVIGASVGSLNGWMIAAGIPPEDLIYHWLSLETAEVRFRMPAVLADGVLDCSALEDRLRQMWRDYRPAIKYGLVATEMPALRPRLFAWPDLSWQHLACSCAVPGFLRHHKLDGRYYSDGGLLDPLPLWAAVEMGATRIIAVNLMKHRPLVMRAAVRVARAWSRYRPEMGSEIRVVEIAPPGPLGSARESMYWSREKAAQWIEAGKRDAIQSKQLIVECLGQGT